MPFLTDPSIALQGKPLDYGQIVNNSNANAAAQQQLRLSSYQLADAGKQFQDDNAARQAFSANTQQNPDGSVSLNRAGALGDLYKTAPTAAVKYSQQFAMQDLANAKARADIQKTQLENLAAHTTYMSTHLQGILNAPTPEAKQAAYAQSRQQMLQDGVLNPQSDPGPNYPGDQYIQRQLAQTLSQKDTIDQQREAATQAETVRHNLADEATKAKSIPIANQVTAAMSVPAAQRTPAQNALISGNAQYTQATKTAPGVAIAQSRPVQVIDPNNPGNTHFVAGGQAIAQNLSGMGSATHQSAVGTLNDASHGQIAQTITAGNTLRHHLELYDQAVDAVNNGNSKMLNSIGNTLGVQMGNDAQTNLGLIRHAVAIESARFHIGASPNESDIKEQNDLLSGDGSPKQMHGGAATVRALAVGKQSALTEQVNAGLQGKVAPMAPMKASSGSISKDGFTVTAPDGSVHKFPNAKWAATFAQKAGVQ